MKSSIVAVYDIWPLQDHMHLLTFYDLGWFPVFLLQMHKDVLASQELETSILKTLEVSKTLRKQVNFQYGISETVASSCDVLIDCQFWDCFTLALLNMWSHCYVLTLIWDCIAMFLLYYEIAMLCSYFIMRLYFYVLTLLCHCIAMFLLTSLHYYILLYYEIAFLCSYLSMRLHLYVLTLLWDYIAVFLLYYEIALLCHYLIMRLFAMSLLIMRLLFRSYLITRLVCYFVTGFEIAMSLLNFEISSCPHLVSPSNLECMSGNVPDIL